MKRLFVDTNIVIDLLDKRAPFWDSAARLFAMAYYKQVELVIAPVTYTTASFLLEKKNNRESVRKNLAYLRQLSHVALIDEPIVDKAITSQFDDFEDAVQYYAALKAQADVIITRKEKTSSTPNFRS